MTATESSQRFPFIGLKKAIERAKLLYDADQRGAEMSVPAAFSVWGYSDKSSGGFQTIAALKMYGLLTDSGANETRKVRLSDDVLRYFRDERDDERTKLLRLFALKPALLRTLWNEWNVAPPSDTVARSHLKIERKLNEQSARTVLGLYKDNLNYAGLKAGANIPKGDTEINGTNEAPAAIVGDFVQWSPGGVDQFNPARRVTWVASDQSHLRVHGSPTGIPMNEVTVVDPPAPPKSAGTPIATPATQDGSDINVYLTGNRLQITADLDMKGLGKLKQILDKYEEILKMLS